MNRRIIISHQRDIAQSLYLVESLPVDGTHYVEIGEQAEDRSAAQNRLAFLWYKAAADQLQDETAEDKRAFCKLTMGVPIRREDEKFREVYDRVIRPLTYEQKLALMVSPIDFPITRDMGVKEMCRYLEAMEVYFSPLIDLPRPEDLMLKAYVKKSK